jgi:hypothetical protein
MQCPTPHSSSRYDAGLRTALQNIHILPPPQTIDDLISRLDHRTAGASADLAQIILDARYPGVPGHQNWSAKGHRKEKGFCDRIWRIVKSNPLQPVHAGMAPRVVVPYSVWQ